MSLDEDTVGSVAAVVVGVLMIRLGFQLWSVLVPGSGLIGIVPVIYIYAAGAGLLGVAVADVDFERHGRKIALATLATVLVGMVALWLRIPPRYGTDAILFARRSSDLVLAGENPYRSSMAPAVEQYGAETHLTPRLDGSVVNQLSYPAGSVLVFLPEAALAPASTLSGTLVVLSVTTFGLLIWDSPPALALVPLTLWGARNWVWSGIGGLIDCLWLVPVLLSMRLWYQERFVLAAVPLGVACSIKQQPWLIVPFLAIWLFSELDTDAFVAVGGRAAAVGAGTFLAINLPFLATAPRAWIDGVLTPLTADPPLAFQGVGLTLLTVSGTYPLPTWTFTVFLASGAAVAVTAYALWFERLRWTAWIAPGALLLLPHRSLNSYIMFMLPIAVYATWAHLGVLSVKTPDPEPAESEVGHATTA